MILCIIQARMGSTRLPGKVLKEVCGKTLLEHEIDRLKHCKYIEQFVVATTMSKSDDAIVEFCRKKNINHFRGSENDVLDRFYQAAVSQGLKEGDAIIRITADCPLIDPVIVDKVVTLFRDSGADYAANINPPTFPDGLDNEIFKFSALEKAWKEARLQSEREHVTLHIRNHPERYSIANLYNDKDYSGLRWTVDEPEDLEVIKEIYQSLYTEKELFLMEDVLEFLDKNKEVQEYNKKFFRDEGLIKSLQNDKVVE